MPEITGFWKDLGLGPVGEVYAPRLAFRLSSPAISPGGNVIFTDPVYATPNGSTGAFNRDLTRTDNLRPTDPNVDRVWINVSAEWLEDSDDPLSGFSRFVCELRVTGPGLITDFLDIPVITGQVVVTNDGTLPALGPGVLIVDTSGEFPHLSFTKN